MTTIGRSVTISGELVSGEDLVIQGRVKGPVTVREGTLTIEEHARLDGDVRGPRVVIRGHVRGSVTASARIELHASANVSGSVSANMVVIADGATYHGGIDMGQRTISTKVAQYKAAQA
jgi:cytoskeletal protein CcmA (bactofilin family)